MTGFLEFSDAGVKALVHLKRVDCRVGLRSKPLGEIDLVVEYPYTATGPDVLGFPHAPFFFHLDALLTLDAALAKAEALLLPREAA